MPPSSGQRENETNRKKLLCYVPEDIIVHSHGCENLTCNGSLLVFKNEK
jgi:hypothetical protein